MRNERIQIVCAAAGLLAPLVVLIALFGSGVFPPQPAYSTPAELATFYASSSNLKMAGVVVAMMALIAVGPVAAVISLQMLRIEERHPILAFLQLAAGAVTWVCLTIPLLLILVIAYRPDRNPDTTQTLHDMAWILFLITVPPFIAQNVAIATSILQDRGARPVFPRWVAWFNLLVAASFVPDLLLPFFKSGPFAYHGVVAFWIPTLTYGLWLSLMGFVLIRTIRHEAEAEREHMAATADAGPVDA